MADREDPPHSRRCKTQHRLVRMVTGFDVEDGKGGLSPESCAGKEGVRPAPAVTPPTLEPAAAGAGLVCEPQTERVSLAAAGAAADTTVARTEGYHAQFPAHKLHPGREEAAGGGAGRGRGLLHLLLRLKWATVARTVPTVAVACQYI